MNVAGPSDYRWASEVDQSDPFDESSAARALLRSVANRWMMLILVALQERGAMRFSELEAAIGGISRRMLILSLRELEARGVIDRTVQAGAGRRVTYELTGHANALVDAAAILLRWVSEASGPTVTADAQRDRAAHGRSDPPDQIASRDAEAGRNGLSPSSD